MVKQDGSQQQAGNGGQSERMAVQGVHGRCHLAASWRQRSPSAQHGRISSKFRGTRCIAVEYQGGSSRWVAQFTCFTLAQHAHCAGGGDWGSTHIFSIWAQTGTGMPPRPAAPCPNLGLFLSTALASPESPASPAPPRPPRPCSPHVVGCVQAAHLALGAVGKLVLLGDVIWKAVCTCT